MRKLFNCHYKYLMTKTNLLSLLIIIIIIIAGYWLSIDGSNVMFEVQEYFYQSFFITKLLLVLMMSFISSNNFIQKNDQYSFLVLTIGYRKDQYIISKILIIFLLFGFIIIILLTVFLLFGAVGIKNFTFEYNYVLMYFKIYLVATIYSLYTVLLTQVIDSIFSSIISFTLMLITDMIFGNELTTFTKGLYLFFPNISFENNDLFFGYSHLFVLIIILVLLNILLYQKKDLA